MAGKPAGRLGDQHCGHSCFPPTSLVSASVNVKINQKGAMRVGDSYQPHCCGPSCHGVTQASGSSTVIINGKPAGRLGDSTACGATVISGSGNVIVGG